MTSYISIEPDATEQRPLTTLNGSNVATAAEPPIIFNNDFTNNISLNIKVRNHYCPVKVD